MRRRVLSHLFALACLSTLGSVAPAQAQVPQLDTAAIEQLDAQGVHDIIVRRAPGLSYGERGDLRSDAGVTHVDTMVTPDSEVVQAPTGQLADAIATLDADPDVVYAEPDAPVHAATTDNYWGLQWALHNTGQPILGISGIAGDDIDAPGAWATTTGTGETVAIVDTGVELAAPDLQGAIATNAGETGTDAQGHDRQSNGVDDDHDGFVDDWQGWDFVASDNIPQDENGHGTHVAGIIAARKDNGLGIAGVAPSAQLLPLRVLDAAGSGTSATVANAFALAGKLGIPVVNASLGAGAPSQAEADAIAAHPDTLYVVAAGNGDTTGAGIDDDGAGAFWPCASPQPNVVCVGASDSSDNAAPFSNYGQTTVDLFAPGVNIASTWTNSPTGAGRYVYATGTSMATPMVSGTVALMGAANPALDANELKARLLDSVDERPTLDTLSVTGGRLDASTAVGAAAIDTDSDGDGFRDTVDAFPHDPTEHADTDHDGIGDHADNCPLIANASQTDSDHDGSGDACDATPNGSTVGSGAGNIDDTTTTSVTPPPTTPVTATTPTVDTTPTTPTDAGRPTHEVSPVSFASTAPRLTAPRLRRTSQANGSLALSFSLDRPARVTLTFMRRVRGRYRAVLFVRLAAARGADRFTFRTLLTRHHLVAGRYRLDLQAANGSQRSTLWRLAFRLR